MPHSLRFLGDASAKVFPYCPLCVGNTLAGTPCVPFASLCSLKSEAVEKFCLSLFFQDKMGVEEYRSIILFPMSPELRTVNSVSLDWFTGQLYWASSFARVICAGLSDGRGYVKILEKDLVPEQLIVFPAKK